MSKSIIEIENIGKRYRLGVQKEKYYSLREEIVNWFSPAMHRQRAAKKEFWALNDVSFSVREGEAVGIIGRNGAGKSTLLKVLSQITPPTTGKITMRGRVASLLEVGTGFHPELTGRENIYLNGAILGMTRKEIARKFDEIVAFSEIEKFLDTPVKRYSSGMYVRLAFAVAAHLEPEILIVDEVLAVGDVDFQRKCLGKMSQVTSSGRTVLFVSHNLSAVATLCDRGVVLANGQVEFNGNVTDAIAAYTGTTESGNAFAARSPSLQENKQAAYISKLWLSKDSGSMADVFFVGEPMTVSMSAYLAEPMESFQLSFIIATEAGLNVYHCLSQDVGKYFTADAGIVNITARFPELKLYPGRYVIHDAWLATGDGKTLDVFDSMVTFSVPNTSPLLHRELRNTKAVVHETPEWFG